MTVSRATGGVRSDASKLAGALPTTEATMPDVEGQNHQPRRSFVIRGNKQHSSERIGGMQP